MGVLCDLVFSSCTHSVSAHMLLSLGHVFSLHGQSFLYALSTLKILSSLSMNSPAVSCVFSTQLCEHALGTCLVFFASLAH